MRILGFQHTLEGRNVVYRIRYSDTQGQRSDEVLVEAHNTAEAMVKFCHARGPSPGMGRSGGRVSITPEAGDELALGELGAGSSP